VRYQTAPRPDVGRCISCLESGRNAKGACRQGGKFSFDLIVRINLGAVSRKAREFLYNGLKLFKDFSKLTDD
jgi:hypothetical protein